MSSDTLGSEAKEEVLLSGEEMKKVSEKCDPWHVHGNTEYHSKLNDIDEFEATMKAKLPQVQLPIDMGWTGYPVLTCEPSKCPKRGWCLDSANRFTAFLDGHWMFRRYCAGGPMMYGKLEHSCSNEMWPEKRQEFLAML